MELLKITNANVISFNKVAKLSGGLYVNFTSSENLTKGQKLKLLFEEKPHYFEVSYISINGNNLEITAIEVGYWASKFDNIKDVDLRKIIGLDLEIITDEETVSKINQMSCWC